MQAKRLKIPDVILLEPKVFADDRGFFLESFNQRQLEAILGFSISFVQDNHSCSKKNVLRGLHYQLNYPQGKLIRVTSGAVFDVAVDLRRSSPTFGQWVSEVVSADNKKQIWIPAGFAHGFAVLSDKAEMLYKTTDYWAAEDEQCIAWNDTDIGIDWPLETAPQLSAKDSQGLAFHQAPVFE